MKKASLYVMAGTVSALLGANTFAGDFTCQDGTTGEVYTSTTSHFECRYPTGNCTWWAAYKRPDLATAGIHGNGGEWSNIAEDLGFMVGPAPKDGAVAEFSSPGHVAYVTNTHSDGSFDVSEMDATGSQSFNPGVNHATYSPNGNGTYKRNGLGSWTLRGFIYGKDPNTIPGNTFTVRRVGNYAWYPAYSSCIQAEAWYGLNSDRKIVRSYGSESCRWIYETLYPQEVSYDALFGDAQACYQ